MAQAHSQALKPTSIMPKINLVLTTVFVLFSFLLGFGLSEMNHRTNPMATPTTATEVPIGPGNTGDDWHGNVMRSSPSQ